MDIGMLRCNSKLEGGREREKNDLSVRKITDLSFAAKLDKIHVRESVLPEVPLQARVGYMGSGVVDEHSARWASSAVAADDDDEVAETVALD